MANIQKELNNIKNAMYGKDVRGSIHDGIYAINVEVENNSNAQSGLEQTFKKLIINAGDSNAEVVMARGEFETLDDRFKSIENKHEELKNTKIVMPKPSTTKNNTETFQSYLDLAKNSDVRIVIQFGEGEYTLNTCIIHSNTEIVLSENTKLTHIRSQAFNPENNSNVYLSPFLMNAKPFDEEASKITGYNGNGNIKITGGVIEAYCACVFVHGENIEINNVKFINAKTDHVFQVGACKNFKIIDCEFEGVKEASSDRQYVEMVQLDYMVSKALPYWVTTAEIFDNTPNDGFIVNNCKFRKGLGTYNFLYTGIGSHSSNDIKNKNITIKNCIFENFAYAGVTLRYMENVLLENNRFETSSDATSINMQNAENVNIINNFVNGGYRSIFSTYNNSINIDNLYVQNITSESDYLLIGEANIVNVNNLTLNNCKGASYNMLLRNVSNVSVQNCKDISTEATNNVFVRAYTKDDGITKNILIKNISTDKEEIDINDASNVINDNVYETLWEGSKTTGNIVLKDSLDKFYDYRIVVNMYGAIDRELMFADNGKFLLRELNLRDDGLLPNLGFTECCISKINNTKLNIDRLIQVNISSNGSLSNVETSSNIKKIYAKRKKY